MNGAPTIHHSPFTIHFLSRLLVGLVALLALVVAGAWLAVRGSLPGIEGELPAPGLTASTAVIERDALGVVTVTARTREDVAYATGFAHAQDRYFQMDLARRMSAGRLAELFGDVALDADAQHRLHRFAAVASRVLAGLPPTERALLEAYARGVNAGLASLRVRPFEYLLLRQRPAPWEARDSLLVVFTMYLQLNDSGAASDRQRGLLQSALPVEVFRFLYSPAPDWEAPIDGVVVAAVPMPTAERYDLRRWARATPRVATAAVTSSTAVENRAVGSNSWAVAGELTQSGAAIVANDMHLGLGVPNTWYRMRLLVAAAAPGDRRDLMGVTLPGTPLLVAGSNGHIAWGFTNSYGDWSDLARIERSRDGRQYRGTQGWTAFGRAQEALRSSSGATRNVQIEQTEWGPVLPRPGGAPRAGPSGAAAAPGSEFALAWTAHRPEATNLAWLRLESTPDCATALPLANTIGGPVQNFVCADAGGAIGWTLLGRMPLRGAAYDATVPSDWTKPGAGWQGWRDPSTYPRVLAPAGGRIWTANNRVVGGEMLAAIGDGAPDRGARARQIRDDLLGLAAGRVTEDDMLRIQLDDRAVFLMRWQALLVGLLDPASLSQEPQRAAMLEHVLHWEPRASDTSVGYRLVRAFHETLERRVFDALTLPVRAAQPELVLQVPRQFEEAVWQLANARPAHLLDPRFHDWRSFLLEVVDESLRTVANDCKDPTLASCTWGRANATRVQHPLSRALPALARFLDMPSVPMAGDHDMPHVHAPGFGASERFAVAPGHEDRAYFHMPGGQSGHPLSPYYRAGHAAWARGRRLPFLPGPAEHTLTLRRD